MVRAWDVAAALSVEDPYPTRPIEAVAEVLSPEDQPARVLAKCQHYQEIGIGQIYIFDPQLRTAQLWNAERDALEVVDTMYLGNGTVMLVSSIWTTLAQKISRRT
jgi:Uma2 family endonuclease